MAPTTPSMWTSRRSSSTMGEYFIISHCCLSFYHFFCPVYKVHTVLTDLLLPVLVLFFKKYFSNPEHPSFVPTSANVCLRGMRPHTFHHQGQSRPGNVRRLRCTGEGSTPDGKHRRSTRDRENAQTCVLGNVLGFFVFGFFVFGFFVLGFFVAGE